MIAQSSATYDVFISFNHRDKDMAASIADVLRSYGLVVFVDEVAVGAEVEDNLWNAMAESRAVVIVVPDDSATANMAFELGAARAWNKPVYAVTTTPNADRLPMSLRDVPLYPLSRIEEVAQLITQAADPFSDDDKQRLAGAYVKVGVPTDQLLLQPRELGKLVKQFNKRSKRQVSGEQLMAQLLRLRKQGALPPLASRPRKSAS